MSRIIVIAGDLASGKSTLAKNLSDHFKIPYFTKEGIKELLSEEIEFSDRSENKKLSNSALKILIHILDRVTKVHGDVILEANFHSEELEKIKRECELHHTEVTLLYLTGDIDVLYERFMYREYYQNRHPVHLTHPLQDVDEFENYVMKWRNEPEVLPRHYIDVTNCDREVIFAKALETLKQLEQK
ncbi:MAG TPA: AAA family ATPase [Bacilli bacterium]|nr:AAA family ATPase [Bacilli bacterium]